MFPFLGFHSRRVFVVGLCWLCWETFPSSSRAADPVTPPSTSALHVGAAAVELEADDSMVIAGGITPGKARGQEGKLRAVATVLEKNGSGKLAIVACDILMITRQHLDRVVREIEKATGIPGDRILINCTHTHHAPSAVLLHDYNEDPRFVSVVQRAMVQAVEKAHTNLSTNDCQFYFGLGEEKTVGQNSRRLMSDGQVYWVGPHDFVRPTGPFDPELPVLAFGESKEHLRALIFNHSTHTIGTRSGGVRSPSFYGLAAQELETELGGIVTFLEGASGSTHNLTLNGSEMTRRVGLAVREALKRAEARPVGRLEARKWPFKFRVRHFDETAEEAAVLRYCQKNIGASAETVANVFRTMRKNLAPHQGEERESWLQVLLIGDVALVGVPAEFFTKLGLDIKNRSPFRHTYVAELANDWIGYLPDRDAFKLGGYQVWTGYHSYAEAGTGERIVDDVVARLKELKR